MSTALRPRSELEIPRKAGEHAPDATRFGWSALLDIDLADWQGSRRVGHDRIPPRRLVYFDNVTTDRPAEDEKNFRDLGTAMTVGRELVTRTAAECAFDVSQNYFPRGFTRLLSLTAREDAEEIYSAVYDESLPTLKAALEYFDSGEALGRAALLPEGRREAGVRLADDMREACVRAWVWANETLDSTENEMRERASGGKSGKRKYDELDLYLYEQTERVKPEFQAAQATVEHGAAVGASIAEALARNDRGGELADVLRALSEKQEKTDERLAQIAEQNALTNQAILALLQAQQQPEQKKGK